MKLIETNFNLFHSWNCHRKEFFFSLPESGNYSPSFHEKRSWKWEIKFCVKNVTCKKYRNQSSNKINRDDNVFSKQFAKSCRILLITFISILYLAIQPFQKKYNWMLVLAQKNLIIQNKSSKTKLKITKKKKEKEEQLQSYVRRWIIIIIKLK